MSSEGATDTDTTQINVDGVPEDHHTAAAGASMPTAGGKPDPGLQFLREITLTPEEEQEYTRQAKANVPGIVAMESGTKDDGWKSVASIFGASVSSKASETSAGRVVCRGQTQLPGEVTMKLLLEQFVRAYNRSDMLAQQMRSSDPMSRETKIMYQVPCEENEFLRLVWGSFVAVGVTWARDFSLLQHATMTTDSTTGERVLVVVAHSIDRPEVPDMEKLCKRIRSTAETTGYVFRESADGTIRASYVVNVNPNGWIPTKIVNTIAINQALNVNRVKRKFIETAEALAAMEVEPPLLSKDLGWRCTYEEVIPRPASAAAPSRVTVKFWGNGKVWFRIRGAGASAVTDWKPAEASSTFRDGGWMAYSKRTGGSVEFTLLPGGQNGHNGGGGAGGADSELHREDEACVLEWKAGGWFKGLSVYHSVTVS